MLRRSQTAAIRSLFLILLSWRALVFDVFPANVTRVTPSSAGVGDSLTIEGTGFSGVTAVTFNRNAAIFRIVSDETIVARVPMGAVEGLIEIWKGDEITVLPLPFVLQAEPASVIGWGSQSFQWGRDQTVAPDNLRNSIAIAAGSTFSLALTGERNLVGWGEIPFLPLSFTTNIAAVTAEGTLILAIRPNGTLLGRNVTPYSHFKRFPRAATNIVAATIAGHGGSVLRRDGKVFQLVIDNYAEEQVSESPFDIPPAIAIAGDRYNGLALHPSGFVSAWTEENKPFTLPVSNIVAVAAVPRTIMTLDQSGELRVFQTPYSSSKIISNVTDIASQSLFLLGISDDGRPFASGTGDYGETNVPPWLDHVVAVRGGGAHGLALARLPAKIIHPPIDQRAAPGGSVTLKAVAVGDGPLNFQWLQDGKPLDGATSAFLSLQNISQKDEGDYRLLIWNSRNIEVSEPARLAVLDDFVAFGFSAPELPGSTITIYGRGLDNTTAITFNGNGAAFVILDENRIQAWIPFGIVQGKVRVWVNGGYSEIPETYSPPPERQILVGWQNYALPGIAAPVPTNLDSLVAISAGGSHSLGLRADGTVAVWGAGAPGSPITTDKDYKQVVVPESATNIIAISAGLYHSIVLRADGTVVSWGGVPGWSPGPPPLDLRNVTRISAGNTHNLALLADGSVRGWGNNSEHALDIPPELMHAVAIAAGAEESIAIQADGTAVLWGGRGYLVPKFIKPKSPFIRASSRSVTLLLSADGSTQLDYPGQPSGNVPKPPKFPLNDASIGWYDFGVGINLLGDLIAWHYAPSINLTTPEVHDVTMVSAGITHGIALAKQPPLIRREPQDHNLVVGSSTTLSADVRFASAYQWFKNGEVIPGATNIDLFLSSIQPSDRGHYFLVASNIVGAISTRSADIRIVSSPHISSFIPARAAVGDTIQIGGKGFAFATAVTFNGNAAVFRVVDDSTIEAVVPPAWANGSINVFVGHYRALSPEGFALTPSGGGIFSWGGKSSPLFASNPGVTNVPGGLFDPVLLSAGDYFSSAFLGDGRSYTWMPDLTVLSNFVAVIRAGEWYGLTPEGRILSFPINRPWLDPGMPAVNMMPVGPNRIAVLLQAGTIVRSKDPSVEGLPPPSHAVITAMAIGFTHSLALTSEGEVITGGINYFGLRDVPGFATNVVAIACGGNHSLALRRDGGLIAWGNNQYGQTNVPPGLSNVIQIAAGNSVSLALLADGRIFAWGSNENGMLDFPAGLGKVSQIAASTLHAVAIARTPSVQIEPPPPIVASGTSLSLQAVSSAPSPIYYRWLKGGSPIPGETNSILNMPNVTSSSSGDYTVQVVHSLGGDISSPVHVQVRDPLIVNRFRQGADHGEFLFEASRSNNSNALNLTDLRVYRSASIFGPWVPLDPPSTPFGAGFIFHDAGATNAVQFYKLFEPQ
jgi:alpha-tubulin suppressor-like RCC1 family protein